MCYERSETVDEGDDDDLPVPDELQLKSLRQPDRPVIFPFERDQPDASNTAPPKGLLMGE
jgi:hypothetical protein